jgi:hypothetical protein
VPEKRFPGAVRALRGFAEVKLRIGFPIRWKSLFQNSDLLQRHFGRRKTKYEVFVSHFVFGAHRFRIRLKLVFDVQKVAERFGSS